MAVTAPEPKLTSFLDYRQLILTLATDLDRLQRYAAKLGLEKTQSMIEDVRRRIEQDCFTVAVVGEFKRGKSTFINALLGQDILPSDVLPTTATLNRVVYGVQKGVLVRFKDGHEEQVSIEGLADYVTKLTDKSETMAAAVSEAVVYYPVPYCQNNVDIIDTPGLNDDETMTAVTLSVLPKVDVAILVIMAQAPLSEYERDFLENKLLTSDLGRVIFVVTAIDRFDRPEDGDRVVESIRGRIKSLVMRRAEQQYGRDSEEYKVYIRKIGEPKIFGLSAKQALDAKLTHDSGRLEKSRFGVFEQALEKFLTQERGSVVLQVPVNRLIATSAEVLEAIRVREGALGMELGQFRKAHDEAQAELEKLRARKQEELAGVDEAAGKVKLAVRPIADGVRDSLAKAAGDTIDATQVTGESLKEPAYKRFREKLDRQIEQAVVNASNRTSERMQAEIERGLTSEANRLMVFTGVVDEIMRSVDLKFVDVTPDLTRKRSAGIEGAIAAVAVFTGFGGAWSGYREAGGKGALVGSAASLGTFLAVGAIAGAVSLPVSLPLVVGGMALSYLTGGALTKKLFEHDRVDRFKADYKAKVVASIGDQLRSMDLERKINDQINATFAVLKQQVDHEVEALIESTQATLADVRGKLERGETLTDEQRKDFAEMHSETERIRGNAERLANQLIQAMSV